MTEILRSSATKDFLFHLQASLESENGELVVTALSFQKKIISIASRESPEAAVSIVATGLQSALRNEHMEIRRAAVQCYVELYRIFGKDRMDEHIACLPKPQQELVLLYCAKHHIR
jgi:hypothetical protein